jgi:hypothetical protein
VNVTGTADLEEGVCAWLPVRAEHPPGSFAELVEVVLQNVDLALDLLKGGTSGVTRTRPAASIVGRCRATCTRAGTSSLPGWMCSSKMPMRFMDRLLRG